MVTTASGVCFDKYSSANVREEGLMYRRERERKAGGYKWVAR